VWKRGGKVFSTLVVIPVSVVGYGSSALGASFQADRAFKNAGFDAEEDLTMTKKWNTIR
jgi:hypothetical protein